MPNTVTLFESYHPSEKKRRWLAILSTDKELVEDEIVRLYGKRWDIEVFFKMCNQHLKLADEIQFIDALSRIMQMAMVEMQGARKMPEKVLESIMFTVMGIAIVFFGFSGDKSNLLSEA